MNICINCVGNIICKLEITKYFVRLMRLCMTDLFSINIIGVDNISKFKT